MVAKYVADLSQEVSAARLSRYRSGGDSDLDMAVNYLWNMTLAGAFHPGLGALEIGLRNSVHNVLTLKYGTDLWFFHPDFARNRILGREVSRAVERLGGAATQPAAGRIVAELHFFYWTTILSRDYHHLLWNVDRAALLRMVFPHLNGRGFRRDLIHQRYNTIRIFRNRVMHHEPLIFGLTQRGQSTIDLVTMHGNIVEAVGWSSPQLKASLTLIDPFPSTHARGRGSVELALKQHLGMP